MEREKPTHSHLARHISITCRRRRVCGHDGNNAAGREPVNVPWIWNGLYLGDLAVFLAPAVIWAIWTLGYRRGYAHSENEHARARRIGGQHVR